MYAAALLLVATVFFFTPNAYHSRYGTLAQRIPSFRLVVL